MRGRWPSELGELQREVHDMLRVEGKPQSAYAILAQLRSERPKLAPPTVYRTLKQLISIGFVHRLESLNAYIACRCAEHSGTTVFTICDRCGAVDEHVDDGLVDRVRALGASSGFLAERPVVEVHGACGGCRDDRRPTGVMA